MHLGSPDVKELRLAPLWKLRDVEGLAHWLSNGLVRFIVWSFSGQNIDVA